MDDTQRTGWQKRILLFLTSQCITLFGSTLVQMALVWYATMQTSSGAWVAAFTVCSYLPQFLISFVGGVWADRYHRKRLIIGADMLIAFATFIMVLAIPHISSEPALLGGLLVMSVIRSLGRNTNSSGQRCYSTACPGGSAYAVQRHQCNHAVYCQFRGSGGGRCSFCNQHIENYAYDRHCNGDLGNEPIVLLGTSETKYFH